MSDKDLVKEILSKLSGNFYNDGSCITDSDIAADALIETLYNVGLLPFVEWAKGLDKNGLMETSFSIRE